MTLEIYVLFKSDSFVQIADGNARQFQRVRNNQVCEARGGDCWKVLDLFAKHLKPPSPIPGNLFSKVNYVNDLDWIIMSSEGTGV